MVRATRRSASAVPVSSPVQSSPKRRRKTIPSPPPEESDGDASDTSIMTTITTKSTSTITSTISSRAPSRRTTRGGGRSSSTRQSTRRTTRKPLTTTVLQPENFAQRSKITPDSSETRSITPSLEKGEPVTPIVKQEVEHDRGTRTSDKENLVPLLAVPSLLGSVRKGQQPTPPPEYISPRKLDIARLTATEPASLSEGPRNRVVITHLVLNNFKSYAGRQVIGPFHTVPRLPVDLWILIIVIFVYCGT
jgi:structural maintenance of chromosome 4